jgi:lysine N6-hydroxylase
VTSHDVYDLAAIGLGPANLSVLALAASDFPELRTVGLDSKASFSWHDGQLLPDSRMLSEFYRDLVTPASPTSRYSFLNYLCEGERLVSFLNSGVLLPTRQEFVRYMEWIADSLSDRLRFDHRVVSVIFHPQEREYLVKTAGVEPVFRARNVVVGVGQSPSSGIPVRGPRDFVFDASDSLDAVARITGGRVAVIGGGQSAGELVDYLTSLADCGAPSSVVWVTPDLAPKVLDTSHYVRDYYSLAYAQRRTSFEPEVLRSVEMAESSAEHGVSAAVLQRIYEKEYQARYLGAGVPLDIVTATRAIEVDARGDRIAVRCACWTEGTVVNLVADAVVLCTGFVDRSLEFLSGIFPDGLLPSLPQIGADFDLGGCDGDGAFIVGRRSQPHGIADQSIAFAAERSLLILERIASRR